MKKNKMRGTFCLRKQMKVAIAFYKTYGILFYYGNFKTIWNKSKRVLGNIPSPQVILMFTSKYLGG